MAQRVTKNMVQRRFEACVSYAASIGIDTTGWRIWQQNENHWHCADGNGSAMLAVGTGLGVGNRQAYDTLDGAVAVLRLVSGTLAAASARAAVTETDVALGDKYMIAPPRQSRTTFEAYG
jgi:hypothetical protein